MFQFVVINILMISVGVVLYLMIRALPRIDGEEDIPSRANILERWITSEIPEKVDVLLNNFLGKFFRRLKIALLKIDNYITKRMEKIKGVQAPNGKRSINFKQIVENKTEKENNRVESPDVL